MTALRSELTVLQPPTSGFARIHKGCESEQMHKTEVRPAPPSLGHSTCHNVHQRLQESQGCCSSRSLQ